MIFMGAKIIICFEICKHLGRFLGEPGSKTAGNGGFFYGGWVFRGSGEVMSSIRVQPEAESSVATKGTISES